MLLGRDERTRASRCSNHLSQQFIGSWSITMIMILNESDIIFIGRKKHTHTHTFFQFATNHTVHTCILLAIFNCSHSLIVVYSLLSPRDDRMSRPMYPGKRTRPLWNQWPKAHSNYWPGVTYSSTIHYVNVDLYWSAFDSRQTVRLIQSFLRNKNDTNNNEWETMTHIHCVT